MQKRFRSRAVIIKNGRVLMMFRKLRLNDGSLKEYYVTPGGGVEGSESLEECVIRELKEEMSVDVKIVSFLGTEESPTSIDNFYKADIISGSPKLSGEEFEKNSPDNYYEPMWIEIKSLKERENVYGLEFINKAIQSDMQKIW